MHQRKTNEDYHALATERGYRWLGPSVVNTTKKTWWECSERHQWEARYTHIQVGFGCPDCRVRSIHHSSILANEARSAAQRLSPEDYHALATERGYRWLGPQVKNVRAKTWWKCPQGHQWESPHRSIQQGRGCPYCANFVNGVTASSQQIAIGTMLGGIINHSVDSYYIDVALEWRGVAVAIEYDGWYWHQSREFDDKQRDITLMRCGWRVLRIKSGEKLPGWQELVVALDELVESPLMYGEIVLSDWRG
jgi:hypothetical protein